VDTHAYNETKRRTREFPESSRARATCTTFCNCNAILVSKTERTFVSASAQQAGAAESVCVRGRAGYSLKIRERSLSAHYPCRLSRLPREESLASQVRDWRESISGRYHALMKSTCLLTKEERRYEKREPHDGAALRT